MFWRSKNKQITSEEYADLLAKVTTLSADVSILKRDFDIMQTAIHSLRGLVNRKLGKTYSGEVEDGDEDIRKEIEDLKAFFQPNVR